MPDLWMDVDAALSEVPVNMMPLIDNTDFKAIEAAIAYNADGLALYWHFCTTAGAYSVTAVTPTTGGDYDWTDQGDAGIYTIEIPASGGASINNDTEGFGWFTGVATGVLPWRGPTIGFRAAGLNNLLIDNAYSTTRALAGTALPDAAADAAGGLPISDAGGLDLDTYIKRLEAAWTAALAARIDENISAAKTLTAAYDAAKTAAAAGAKMDLVDAPNGTAVTAIQSGLAASGEAATAAGAVTVAGYATGQDPATLLGTGSTLTALATSASMTTLANRLGAFTGSGVNTVLGFLKALMSKAASTPSDVGGTFSAATDSVEALQEQGAAIKLITDTPTAVTVTVTSPVAADGALTIYQGDDYSSDEGRQIAFAVADASHVYGLDTATCKLKLFQATWTGTATSTDAGYTVVFQPTDTQTAALTAISQQYELEATLANGHIVTLARGAVTLVKDIPVVV